LFLAGKFGIAETDARLKVLRVDENPATAIAWEGKLLLTADDHALYMRSVEGKHWKAERKILLPGIKQIVHSKEGLFVLVNKAIARVYHERVIPLSLTADSIGASNGWPVGYREGGAFLFDRNGNVHASYEHKPRTMQMFDFPGISVEVVPEKGVLLMHERWESFVSPDNFNYL
jgi:hypothetical protein